MGPSLREVYQGVPSLKSPIHWSPPSHIRSPQPGYIKPSQYQGVDESAPPKV